MIELTGVCKSFNGQVILDHVNLKVAAGEILVILGESGTGKSVLLKHMIGLIRPDAGEVKIEGKNIAHYTERKLLKLRRDIGFVFQEGALYDFMNCYDNIAFPLREHTKLKEKEISDKIGKVLTLLDLKKVEAKMPAELSGGMKKRVALARAIVLDSKILFCDEPTSGLDPIRSRDISNLIRDISRQLHCTTVITSHDVRNALRLADRIILIAKGRIVFDGKGDEFRGSDKKEIQEFLV
ncbi:MAG: ATP-binding cassette domain-containing protein [Candidatus Omnitrophica bacterium]|nr:ATP-binding cassette domain-containing protein [Candidatus Omnitrophota bacterium]MCB9719442.1 ATP-binding cassette domain-containing protein [Candidatus Omnitrophota bacterium]